MLKERQVEQAIEQFWEVIPQVWHNTRGVIRHFAAEKFHLSVEQFQVLRNIRRGTASVSAIASGNRISRSAVSKAVETLVQKGLVFRAQDPNDRRNIPLALTPEGEKTMSSIYNEAEAWLSTHLGSLSGDELDRLMDGFSVLGKAFSKS